MVGAVAPVWVGKGRPMAKKTTRRLFGELEARNSSRTGEVTSWRARYTGPDTERHERPFVDKAGEAWLNAEKIPIDRGEWTPPKGPGRSRWQPSHGWT